MNTELIEVLDSAPASLIAQADNLAAQHEHFHSNYIVAGRAALYGLLANIYDLAEKLDCHVDKVGQLISMRTILAEKYGIRTQDNTPDLTVLVRYVTRADRKTAHVYARAIEAARANQVTPARFAKYVQQAGGIECVRTNSASIGPGWKDAGEIDDLKDLRLALSRKYITARTEFPLASFKLGKKHLLKSSRGGEFKQFICYERDGRYYVLAEHVGKVNPEIELVNLISEMVGADLKRSINSIDTFYKKAMVKRKHRTIRLIRKRRPEVAKKMIGLNEGKVQENIMAKNINDITEVQS